MISELSNLSLTSNPQFLSIFLYFLLRQNYFDGDKNMGLDDKNFGDDGKNFEVVKEKDICLCARRELVEDEGEELFEAWSLLFSAEIMGALFNKLLGIIGKRAQILSIYGFCEVLGYGENRLENGKRVRGGDR